MKKEGMFKEFYECNRCGLIVEIVSGSGYNFSCCGEPGRKMIFNSVDADHEKHVPVIMYSDQGVLVQVGSELHPMIDAHYIEWIEIRYGLRSERKYLKHGDKPEASFRVDSKDISALILCNLHGLWTFEEKRKTA